MVTTPLHENFLCDDTDLHSHNRVEREQAHDLAYRAVIPSPLAYAILGSQQSHAEQEEPPPEEYAVIGHPSSIQLELDSAKLRHLPLLPIIQLQSLLFLSLRRIRFEYLLRSNLWSQL